MVKRCLELNQAFGVIRSGTDGLSEIGTLAEIREATRYIDGRWDIVALGTQRFRVTNFDRSAPYACAPPQSASLICSSTISSSCAA